MSLITALGTGVVSAGVQLTNQILGTQFKAPAATNAAESKKATDAATTAATSRLRQQIRNEVDAAFRSSNSLRDVQERLSQTLPGLLGEYGVTDTELTSIDSALRDAVAAAKSPTDAQESVQRLLSKVASRIAKGEEIDPAIDLVATGKGDLLDTLA